MEPIVDYLVELLTGRVFEVLTDLVGAAIVWAYGLVPQDIRDALSTTVAAQIFGSFGTFDGTVRDLPSAIAGGYSLFTHFFPFKSVIGELIFCYASIGSIRITRWLIGFIPTIEG